MAQQGDPRRKPQPRQVDDLLGHRWCPPLPEQPPLPHEQQFPPVRKWLQVFVGTAAIVGIMVFTR